MAVYWYKKSAEQGHQKAQFNLALVYENRGDIDRANYWYEQGYQNDYNVKLKVGEPPNDKKFQ